MEIVNVPFNELLSFVVDNRGKTCPTAETGIPLIATNCISNQTLYPTKENVRYVDKNTYDTWFRAHPQPNDIIFVLKGSPGRCALTPNPVDFCIAQDMVAIRPDKQKIEPNYLFAALRSPFIQDAIERMHVGTMIPHFKKGDFSKLLIPIPDKKIQKSIGDIYIKFEQKIDLNRRTNETLEAMAQALFRDWFVDFGPTRAKMTGEAPYLAPELWELFPDRLDDEGKPEGWQSLPLTNLATLSKSSINPAKFSDEYFLHFSLPAFDKGMTPDLVKGEEIKSGKFSLPSNSILLSKLNPETPRVWMVTAHKEPYQRVCSTEFMVLNPLQKEWLALIYCACLSQPFRETLQGMVTGTSKSHQRVQPLAVMQTNLLHATDILMRQFGLISQPLLAKINFNRNESHTLAQLRDLLLPKLMSGEISIWDAEKMVEDAA